jgi:CheY-like chemotaxis protein
MSKVRVLWVEDGALVEFAEHAAPVITSGQYDLQIALDASDGLEQLCGNQGFDVVIVDIRLPPGHKPEWVDLFRKGGKNKAQARLGLELLNTCLGGNQSNISINVLPTWITPERFGVYTVETRNTLQPELDRLGVRVFKEKLDTAHDSDSVLLDLIDEVLSKRKEG